MPMRYNKKYLYTYLFLLKNQNFSLFFPPLSNYRTIESFLCVDLYDPRSYDLDQLASSNELE